MLRWLDTVTLPTTAGTLCLQQYIQDYKDRRNKLNLVTKELKRFFEKTYQEDYSLLAKGVIYHKRPYDPEYLQNRMLNDSDRKVSKLVRT